ncbi:MAG: HD domain-containing phosphohydrolase [Solirubrobacterales bacterium]
MTATAKPPRGQSLIDVLAYTTIAFLYDRDLNRSIDRVLARLGQGLEVQRTVLAPLAPHLREHSWAADRREHTFGDARGQLPQATEWVRQLSQGSVVAVDQGRTARECAHMERWRASSLIMAPVFLNGAWWGVLVAAEDSRRRMWSRTHRKLMLAIAGTLSAALHSDAESLRLRESRANLAQAQKRADAYRNRLDELILASQDAIMLIEPDGFVSRWNAAADELLTVAAARRPGRDYRDFFPFAIKKTICTMVEEARAGLASHAQAFTVPVNGTVRNLLVSTFPLGDPPGAVTVMARDQTDMISFRDKLENSLSAAIEALASAMEARDPYTAGHQRRTAELAQAVAVEMGLSENDVRGVYTAAVIHDIGKICVPAEILTCPRRLSEAEFALIKAHPQAGHDIVKSIDFPWPVAEMILQHHEKLDGTGYPFGLAGGAIRMGARILSAADAVEAMSSHRPYRPALGLDYARAQLAEGAGKAFDPQVVKACLNVLKDWPEPTIE